MSVYLDGHESSEFMVGDRVKGGYIKKEPKNEIIQYIRDNKRSQLPTTMRT